MLPFSFLFLLTFLPPVNVDVAALIAVGVGVLGGWLVLGLLCRGASICFVVFLVGIVW
eukprot:SAG31_NODE_3389_length_4328_cov_4.670449_2_plen_58_part_00